MQLAERARHRLKTLGAKSFRELGEIQWFALDEAADVLGEFGDLRIYVPTPSKNLPKMDPKSMKNP